MANKLFAMTDGDYVEVLFIKVLFIKCECGGGT